MHRLGLKHYDHKKKRKSQTVAEKEASNQEFSRGGEKNTLKEKVRVPVGGRLLRIEGRKIIQGGAAKDRDGTGRGREKERGKRRERCTGGEEKESRMMREVNREG